jgi:hypothetical protein
VRARLTAAQEVNYLIFVVFRSKEEHLLVPEGHLVFFMVVVSCLGISVTYLVRGSFSLKVMRLIQMGLGVQVSYLLDLLGWPSKLRNRLVSGLSEAPATIDWIDSSLLGSIHLSVHWGLGRLLASVSVVELSINLLDLQSILLLLLL